MAIRCFLQKMMQTFINLWMNTWMSLRQVPTNSFVMGSCCSSWCTRCQPSQQPLLTFDSYCPADLPQVIQAQRDYFGAHTYQRKDKEGTFHWLLAWRKMQVHGETGIYYLRVTSPIFTQPKRAHVGSGRGMQSHLMASLCDRLWPDFTTACSWGIWRAPGRETVGQKPLRLWPSRRIQDQMRQSSCHFLSISQWLLISWWPVLRLGTLSTNTVSDEVPTRTAICVWM